MWSKHSLRAHLRQELADAAAKPSIHVSHSWTMFHLLHPLTLCVNHLERRWTPKLLMLHWPTTQSCSISVRGPCAVVLSATTTTTIDVGIQCESLAPAIQVVSRAGVPFVCLPRVLRFPLVCPPQVPFSCPPEASSHPPPVFTQPPPVPLSCPPEKSTCRPPLFVVPQTSLSSPPEEASCSPQVLSLDRIDVP